MPHRISHHIQYFAVRGLFGLLGLMPRRARGAVGISLGRLGYWLGIRKGVVLQNLSRAFPTLPEAGKRTLARRCFEHFGTVATSLATSTSVVREDIGDWLYFDGAEELDKAVAGGKGGIVVSGHLGNWEIIGAACARLGYPVSFVVTTQRNKLVQEWLDNVRRKAGVEIIPRKQAIKGVLSALQRNRLVAILIDQDAHEEGVFVPFFGQLSSTPRGPAVFHLRTGSPVIFMSSVRIDGEKYRGKLESIDFEDGADQEQIMAALTAKLESYVRQAPEQWFWMHKRWKTSPPAS
ncbi:MAG: lysophospholipid acyltransferase family protein [Calditrichaeota bacterium]|nr:lysophospholipid acyltransferase family protein [Calditrichota bacterium]MCB9368034.1 lysophospholipid acyltransferase family protein [Calditrichota bacterium]